MFKKYSILQFIPVVTLVLLSGFSTFSQTKPVNAQIIDSCNWTLNLYKDGKNTNYNSSGSLVRSPVADATKYELVVNVNPNDTSCRHFEYSAFYYIDGNRQATVVFNKRDAFTLPNNGVIRERLGSARAGLYAYEVVQYDRNLNGAETGKKVINIQFTDTQTNTNNGQINGGTGINSNNSNTPPIISGETGINTNVGANFNMNLDGSIGNFWNPLEGSVESVPQLITGIIRILFALIGIAAIIIIIISGFRMVLASGNETELTAAKKAITWAIIGLIVSLMSFSIVAIIQRLIQVGAN